MGAGGAGPRAGLGGRLDTVAMCATVANSMAPRVETRRGTCGYQASNDILLLVVLQVAAQDPWGAWACRSCCLQVSIAAVLTHPAYHMGVLRMQPGVEARGAAHPQGTEGKDRFTPSLAEESRAVLRVNSS